MIATELVPGQLYRVNDLILVEAKSKHDAIFFVLRAMFGDGRVK